MVSQPGQIFIGRQPEMAVLTSALDGALSGQGCTVMLAGEPGIGKTRTVQLLGSWFIVGNILALWGERRDRAAQKWITIPVVTPILYGIYLVALAMGIALWLSVWNLMVPLGQGMYVLGLMVLLAFAAVEFLFFIALLSQQDRGRHLALSHDHEARSVRRL